MVNDIALGIDKMAQHVADGSGTFQRGQFIAGQKPVLAKNRMRCEISDRNYGHIQRPRAQENIAHPGMSCQGVAGSRVGCKHRTGHHMAFCTQSGGHAPGKLGRVVVADAGQSAQQRHDTNTFGIARHDGRNRRRQRFSPTKADRHVGVQRLRDKGPNLRTNDRAQLRFVLWGGQYYGFGQAPSLFQRAFQFDAMRQTGGHADLDSAVRSRRRKDP